MFLYSTCVRMVFGRLLCAQARFGRYVFAYVIRCTGCGDSVKVLAEKEFTLSLSKVVEFFGDGNSPSSPDHDWEKHVEGN